MKRTITTFAAVVGVALIAVLGAGARSTDDTITGAGSTFVSPLVSVWTADYAGKTGVKVAYSPVGSGAGIAAITARQVDFGAVVLRRRDSGAPWLSTLKAPTAFAEEAPQPLMPAVAVHAVVPERADGDGGRGEGQGAARERQELAQRPRDAMR